MRVLLLTQVLPYPPDSGPKVKTYYVLKYLAQHHQVTLVSFVRDSDKPEYVHHLETLCERVITVPITRSPVRDLRFLAKSLLTGRPWMMLRDERPEMVSALESLAGQHFDVVHADQLNMAQYALLFPKSHKVLDLHNALWMLYKRLAQTTRLSSPMKYILLRDWRLLKRYEGEMCRIFNTVVAVSDEDRQLLIEAGGRKDILVVPIAIDTTEQAYIDRAPDGPHIIHIGTMYWPPNIDGILWFLDEIYPRIQQKVAGVRCTLIGARPPESITQRGQADKSITVTGYVEDPMPYFQDSSMMIVPVRAGGGMRVKILNALSQGIPIVSTVVGCEGIAVANEHDILIEDEPQAFADACIRLLTNPDLNEQISRIGRHTAVQKYDYHEACRPLDIVYSPVTQNS